MELFDHIGLKTPGGEEHLLAAFKSPVKPADVPLIRQRLGRALAEQRQHSPSLTSALPTLITDQATSKVMEACQREHLALVDQAGTVLVAGSKLFVHIVGRARVERKSRVSVFRGNGARIVRLLLERPFTSLHATEVAKLTRNSFGHAQAVLTRLESDGLVARRSPRTGFRVTSAVDLVSAWRNEKEGDAAVVEPFYLPSTAPLQALMAGSPLLGHRAHTLLSALSPRQVAVGGLPHGMYWGGETQAVVDALGLRKVTPHNFFLLRPRPSAATTEWGVFQHSELRVTVPQLIVDFARYGGTRGVEQSDALIRYWSREILPELSADARD